MSVDRLQALRAQRKANSETTVTQAHEMQTLSMPMLNPDDMTSFLSEITSIGGGIKQLQNNVKHISTLRSQSLSVVHTSGDGNQEFDDLVDNTRTLHNALKERIKALEANRPRSGPNVQTCKSQTAVVRSQFLETIQEYARLEQNYRKLTEATIKRQLLIVKPDATAEEIQETVSGTTGSAQVFTQALTTSTRYGDGRAAYQDVQVRHQDIRRMEETLAELAQLFNDMGELVEQADPMLNNIEKNTFQVSENTEAAVGNLDQAVISARAWRKKKWICFGIFVLVLVVIAIVLAIEIPKKYCTISTKCSWGVTRYVKTFI